MIETNNDIEAIFIPSNIDMNCELISNLMPPFVENIKKLVLAGLYSQAIRLFLQLADATCRHFISDEHYDYFDDEYSPVYPLDSGFEIIANAYRDGKLSQEEQKQLISGIEEIGQSEAFQNYGYPNIDVWEKII